MKTVLIGVVVVVAAVAIGGGYLLLRSDGADGVTTYAARLDALCADESRQVEALGRPGEITIGEQYHGTVRIGRSFLQEARKLQPPAAQAAAAETFLKQRALYYDGLEYGYQFLETQKNQVAFVRIVNGALANLATAEAAAKTLGAHACTLRPFE